MPVQNPTGLIDCPLGQRCDTASKKHRAGSLILREHIGMATNWESTAVASAFAPRRKPYERKDPLEFSDYDTVGDFLDAAQVSSEFSHDGVRIELYRGDNDTSVSIPTDEAVEIAGVGTDDEDFELNLVNALGEHRNLNDHDTNFDAAVRVAEDYPDYSPGEISEMLDVVDSAEAVNVLFPYDQNIEGVIARSFAAADSPEEATRGVGQELMAESGNFFRHVGRDYSYDASREVVSGSDTFEAGFNDTLRVIEFPGSYDTEEAPDYEYVVGKAALDRAYVARQTSLYPTRRNTARLYAERTGYDEELVDVAMAAADESSSLRRVRAHAKQFFGDYDR